MVAAAVSDDPAARGDDVLVPGRVLTEGQRDDKPVPSRPHAEGACIHAPGSPAAMVQDADDGHPASACEQQHQRVDEAGRETDYASGPRAKVDASRVSHDPRTGLFSAV